MFFKNSYICYIIQKRGQDKMPGDILFVIKLIKEKKDKALWDAIVDIQ